MSSAEDLGISIPKEIFQFIYCPFCGNEIQLQPLRVGEVIESVENQVFDMSPSESEFVSRNRIMTLSSIGHEIDDTFRHTDRLGIAKTVKHLAHFTGLLCGRCGNKIQLELERWESIDKLQPWFYRGGTGRRNFKKEDYT